MMGPVLLIYAVLSTPHLQPASRRPSKPQHVFQEMHHRVGSLQRTVVAAFDTTLPDHGGPLLVPLLLGINVDPQGPHVLGGLL